MLKRTVLIALLIFLSPSLAHAVTQWCDDADIIGCWNVETGSGTSLVDQSSNSVDGTFHASGSPAWSATVPSGGDGFDGTSSWSVDFDEFDDDISFGDVAAVDNATAITVVNWVYHDSIDSDNCMLCNNDGTTDGFLFFRDDVAFTSGRTDTYQIRIAESDGASNVSIEGATNASPSATWTHVAFTYIENTGTNGLRLYVNGVEDANSPVSTSGLTGIDTGVKVLMLGSDSDDIRRFDGPIDEVAIFDSVQDSTDINDIMDNGLVQAAAGTGTVIN